MKTVNDADRLYKDPTMRRVVDDRQSGKRLPSVSRRGCFETERVAQKKNLALAGQPATSPRRFDSTVNLNTA